MLAVSAIAASFIDGVWTGAGDGAGQLDLIDPATGLPAHRLALAGVADVDRAVAAATRAQPGWAATPVSERRRLLQRIADIYRERYEEIAQAVTAEMGAPITLSRTVQAGSGLAQIDTVISVLEDFAFEERIASGRIVREPIGVCGLITPWNWPVNQVAAKVAPALAAGCAMVLKPSEHAALSATIFARIIEAAGIPFGVFNLVQGTGPVVGAALSAHPGVAMMSFTGSTAAGIDIAMRAAPTVKRVTQELGGKSPLLLLDDADFAAAIPASLDILFANAGQTCTAPTRMIVPRARLAEAEAVARGVAEGLRVGSPLDEATTMGPLVSRRQFDRVQGLIGKATEEGARIVCGGPGRPEGLSGGWYVRPTIFSDVDNAMTIAREEVFGPVLAIIPYDDEEQAIAIANDTPYGLAAYVWSGSVERGANAARGIQAGYVQVNGSAPTLTEPFGGYKQSGNGREWGEHGLREYLETKTLLVTEAA